MPKAVHKIRQNVTEVRRAVMKEMLTLATSAFGLVAALAWNSLIQELVSQYIKPLIGGASDVISLLIYAVLVTGLAVLVTYNLSKLVEKEKA